MRGKRRRGEIRACCNLPVANRKAALENQDSHGVLAQLVEHHNGIVGVRGSNPLGSSPFLTVPENQPV